MGARPRGAGSHISPPRWHLQLLYPSLWVPRGDGHLKYILTPHKLQAFCISNYVRHSLGELLGKSLIWNLFIDSHQSKPGLQPHL
jgi:hypothetical protein